MTAAQWNARLSGPCLMLMHSGILVYSYDTLWRRGTAPNRAVRSDGIVVLSPPLDLDLRVSERIGDFTV